MSPLNQECSQNCTELPSQSDWFISKVRELFGIDVRSLALFRVLLGILLLSDLAIRLPDLVAHYSDAGVLPRLARISLWEGGNSRLAFRWSIHMLSGDYRVQFVLFVIAAVFAFWLLIGYRTRLATIASWIMLVSLQSRNPMVLNGGDVLLRCLLFWGMFLPLGTVFSIDRMRSHLSNKAKLILSPATFAILAQICMVYTFSALFKEQPQWREDFSAIYYALSIDQWTTPFGRQLLDYPRVMAVLTCVTFWLEACVVFFVLCPFYTARLRLMTMAAFVGLHIGIAYCMELGNFSWVASAAWLLFVPSELWDKLAVFFQPIVYQFRSADRQARNNTPDTSIAAPNRIFRRPESPDRQPGWIAGCVCLLLFSYTLVWNVYELGSMPKFISSLPNNWRCLGHATHLCQRWDMFAPPLTEDGWFTIRGTLRNNAKVNLWDPREPVPVKKPANVNAMYPSARWRKYMMRVAQARNSEYRRYLTHWLSYRWNIRAINPSYKVDKVQIAFQAETTPPPSMPLPAPRQLVLWTWDYSPEEIATAGSD